MKIIIATDSFKGSLSTNQAGMAISDGIRAVYPNAEIHIRPIADGGEGTVEAMSIIPNSEIKKVTVHGPLDETVDAEYVKTGKTAILEMSAAAGITLIDRKELNPLKTTTYGVGEMIADAIQNGCRKFIIGIGGSATNDGGVGMLQALGFMFTDEKGDVVPKGAIGVSKIKNINSENAMPELKECTFKIACDVTNPLCGEKGCSAIYGPQKGATPEMINDMDKWLLDYSKLTLKKNPKSDPDTPGAGAAGGMGYAFLSYLNGALQSGIELIIEETKLEEYIKAADMVITGEGRLDGQSVMGKVPVGVAKLAKKYNKPVIAFSGCVTEDAKVLNQYGIDAFFPILKGIVSLEDALKTENAYKNLSDTAEQVFRTIRTFS